MAGHPESEAKAGTGKTAFLRTTKVRLAAVVGGVLMVASGGAYAALRDTGTAGSPAVAQEPAAIPVPMPVPGEPHAHAERATDYSIVSVFDGEAFLATSNNLVRAKVGLNVPGLGTITAIEAAPGGGGSVTGTEATLRTR